MASRHFSAGKRFVAVAALFVATPVLCPGVRVGPLELDPLEQWVVTFDEGIDASDVLLGLSTAGIADWPDGLDGHGMTLGAMNVDEILDAAYSAASVGSAPGYGSLSAGGSGSSPLSASGSGTLGRSGGSHDGISAAATGEGSPITRGSVHSPEATGLPVGTTGGRDALYFGPGRGLAPPVQVALLAPGTDSLPRGTSGMPWHVPVIATGPSVIVKDGDIPLPGDPLIEDETNPGSNGLPGPFLIQTDFTPTDFTPLDDLRLSITVNAVPEPGTLALFALGLVGIALARRKRKRMPR